MVVGIGHRSEGSQRAVGVPAAAVDVAHGGVVDVGDDAEGVEAEEGHELDVGCYGEVARVVGVAVAPVGEPVAVGWGSHECVDGVVGECAGACCSAELGVGAADAHGVVVGVEQCGEGCVAEDCYGAWVVGIAVGPLREVVAVVGQGDDDLRATVVEVAGAESGAVGGGRDGEGELARHELSHVGGVAAHRDVARVVGVAIGPAVEKIAVVWRSRDCDDGVEGVGTRACSGAHGVVGAGDRDGEELRCEESGEECVAQDRDGARVGGDAVGPAAEVIAVCGHCSDDGGSAVGEAAAAVGRAPGGVGREDGDVEVAWHECGCERCVAQDRDGASCGGVAVLPHHEAVAVGRCGCHCGSGEVGVVAQAAHRALRGVVACGDMECVGVEEGCEEAVAEHCDVARVGGDAVGP